jgi:hypothetical protein
MKHYHYIIDERGRIIGLVDIELSSKNYPYIALPIQDELVTLGEFDGTVRKNFIVLDKLVEEDFFTIWSVIDRDRGVVNCLKGFHSFIYS